MNIARQLENNNVAIRVVVIKARLKAQFTKPPRATIKYENARLKDWTQATYDGLQEML